MMASNQNRRLSLQRRSYPVSPLNTRRTSIAPSLFTNKPDSEKTFSKVSPIHGVGRAGEGSNCVRGCYKIIVLAAVVATAVCTFVLVQDILANPNLVMKRVEAKSALDLPKVSICNLNPMKISSLQQFEEYVESQESDDSQLEAVYFGSGKECPFCIDGVIDPVLFREKYSQLPNELKSSYGHQISDMLLTCTFQNQACSSDDFTTYVDPNYGNCFSFNIKTVNTAGHDNGLVLELDLETSEYLPNFSETVGIRVLLESHDLSSCSTRKEAVISPGNDNYLGLKSSFSSGSCSSQTTSLSAGVWPTSITKSVSLISTGGSGSTTGATSTVPHSGSTTSPPTLEEVDGSGDFSMEPPHLVEPNKISKREISDSYYDTDHSLSLNTFEHNEKKPSFFPTVESDELVEPHTADMESNDDINNSDKKIKELWSSEIINDQSERTINTSGETSDHTNIHQDINGALRSNDSIGEDDNNTAESLNTEVESELSNIWRDVYYRIRAMESNEEHVERIRRAAAGDGGGYANAETTHETKSDSVSRARERFSKLRVFYTSLDEEIETTTPAYPWYVATALVGGQVALFCSLSAVAVLEAIEYFFRFIANCGQKLRPNNKVDVRMSW